MSLISSISSSRGRFNKKHRGNKAHDAAKQKSAKKAAVAAKQKHIEDANKKKRSGSGDDLLRMKRLREERESEPGHDEENIILTPHVTGGASLTQIDSEEDQGTANVRSGIAKSVPLGQPKELSLEPGKEAHGEIDAPCATGEKVDEPSGEENGLFGDLFKTVLKEEISPTRSLAASLPDISAQELLDEAEEIKTLLRRRHSSSNR
jgi:hypothetical protein